MGSPEPRPPRVFVYGTLRRGETNHAYLARARYLGGFVTAARYTLVDTGAYPAAIDGGASALVGDVFAVDSAILAALDALEDYPRVYTRRTIATAHGDAWIYLWVGARDPRWPVIAGGDWRARSPNRGEYRVHWLDLAFIRGLFCLAHASLFFGSGIRPGQRRLAERAQ